MNRGDISGLKKGSILRDNDPRYSGRTITVTEVLTEYVVYATATRSARIAKRRVYNDGKARNQGWSVVAF